jgi:eukaryotic-like serine/threonine-protein kinase
VKINTNILGVAKMAWVAGDRLQGGKYTIEKELGRGRFGITYLVKNRNSDRSQCENGWIYWELTKTPSLQ